MAKTVINMWMILFFVLPVAGWAYVIWHLWTMLPVSVAAKSVVVALCVLVAAVMVMNFSHALDNMPMWAARVCYEVGNSSIFILLYLVMTFILVDVARLLRLVPDGLYRSHWLLPTVIAALMIVVFTGGYINYMNKRAKTVVLHTAKIIGRDYRIVMLSDLHLGYHNTVGDLRKWVSAINNSHADLVLLAGDVVDRSFRPLKEEHMAEVLRQIKAPVYACFGNHEYYSGADEAARFFSEAGITLLKDSVATVGDIVIVGRDDRSNLRRKSLNALMNGVDRSKYVIVLDHQPYHLEEAEAAGADFQFSGHTHHGQLWPISLITESVYENTYGPYRRGRTQYYVSSGIGIWGAKFRIGTCSEYVVAELER